MEGDDTNNSAEARDAASSPPPANTDQASDTTAAATDGSSTSQPAQATPAELQEQQQREAFKRLEAGEDPKVVRSSKAPATPSADDQRGAAQAPQAGGELSPTAKPAPPFEAFGMEEATYRTLSRAKMLPTEEEWKSLPGWARGQVVSAAKQTLNAKQAAYQAKQQQQSPPAGQGQVATGADADDQILGDEDLDGDADDQRSAAAASAAGRTGQGTRQAGGGQAAGAGASDQGDPELDPLFAQLADYYGGDETFIAPLRQIVQVLRENGKREVSQARAEVWQLQATSAFDTLQEEIPQLKDDAGRLLVIPLAGALLQQRQSLGQRSSFGECCRDAARAHFHPDQRLQAQQNLLDKRQQSVRGGVHRVANNANPQRAMTKEEKDREKFNRLEAGADPREVRSAF